MFFTLSDWFLYLGISCTIYLPNKTRWRLALFTLRKNIFTINEVAVPDNTKKATKFGNGVFKDMYLFFIDKCTQNVFRNVLFTNDEWATSRHPVKL